MTYEGGELRAVPDHDGGLKRYDPETGKWSVIYEEPPESQLISQPGGSNLYVEYRTSNIVLAPRLSWWRRILYRIALGGRR